MAGENSFNNESNVQDSPMPESPDDSTVPEFRFVTFQDPDTVKLRSIQRVIRAHGVRKTIEARRKKPIEKPTRFRHLAIDRLQQSSSKCVPDPRTSIAVQELDPFQSLAINSARLQALIRNSTARVLWRQHLRLTCVQRALLRR